MERRSRRSFTDDYMQQAVDLVASSDRSVGSVARELGLRDSVLRRWVERRGAGLEPTATTRRPTTQATLPSADHAAELAHLQRENERLRMERDISKSRSRSLLELRNEIRLHRRSPRRYPVTIMCDVLGVSPAGYYAWRARPESRRAADNRQLINDIKRVHRDTSGRYGSPRIHAELRAQGRGASRGRIERLMRRHGIRAIMARPRRVRTTDSCHDSPIASKLLGVSFCSRLVSARNKTIGGKKEKALQAIPHHTRIIPVSRFSTHPKLRCSLKEILWFCRREDAPVHFGQTRIREFIALIGRLLIGFERFYCRPS